MGLIFGVDSGFMNELFVYKRIFLLSLGPGPDMTLHGILSTHIYSPVLRYCLQKAKKNPGIDFIFYALLSQKYYIIFLSFFFKFLLPFHFKLKNLKRKAMEKQLNAIYSLVLSYSNALVLINTILAI